MSVSEASVAARPEVATLAVVISGSFRRGLASLREDRASLTAAQCEILSPQDIEFVREENGFVFSAQDEGRTPTDIEDAHIAAIRAADFVWLHAPDGYLGPSGAFELGVATTGGVPVFTRHEPRDIALREFTRVVSSPSEAATICRTHLVADPGAGVRSLQTYYGRIAKARGWDKESAVESMVLLTEEIGELARAVREGAGLARRRSELSDPAEELADVQLYVAHLANVLGVDLAEAVTRKEIENARRFSISDAQTA